MQAQICFLYPSLRLKEKHDSPSSPLATERGGGGEISERGGVRGGGVREGVKNTCVLLLLALLQIQFHDA